jgi:hypothetical protein
VKIGFISIMACLVLLFSVGLLIGDGKIIHASGNVRIDYLDNHGIFNKTEGKYSHKLKFVKRIL